MPRMADAAGKAEAGAICALFARRALSSEQTLRTSHTAAGKLRPLGKDQEGGFANGLANVRSGAIRTADNFRTRTLLR